MSRSFRAGGPHAPGAPSLVIVLAEELQQIRLIYVGEKMPALAEGSLIAYGNDVNPIHTADGWTQVCWWAGSSLTALFNVVDALSSQPAVTHVLTPQTQTVALGDRHPKVDALSLIVTKRQQNAQIRQYSCDLVRAFI